MKDLRNTIKIVTVSISIIILAMISYLVGYDFGYSAAMDKYLDASECKPSRKWRQRF